MAEPQYKLEGIVHTKTETREDFEGPLDVIFLLLSKNKIEIQDVSITAILEQYQDALWQAVIVSTAVIVIMRWKASWQKF